MIRLEEGGVVLAGKKKMRIFTHYTHTGHELTDQQFWFIHYYIQYHDTKKAAEKAGVSKEHCRTLLDKDFILEELNYLEGRIRDKAEIDTARLYRELWQIGTGFQKDPFGFDIAPADRIKALTELLKRTDDVAQKEKLLKNNSIKVTITRDYSVLESKESDEDSNE